MIGPLQIISLLELTHLKEFHTFPFITTGKALTAEERRERGLLSMGSEYVNGPQAGGTFMRSRWEGPASFVGSLSSRDGS